MILRITERMTMRTIFDFKNEPNKDLLNDLKNAVKKGFKMIIGNDH
jgi:hypothetical protein